MRLTVMQTANHPNSRLSNPVVAALLCAVVACVSANAYSSEIEVISQNIDTGEGANGTSWDPSLSGDGTLVAFSSTATNLIANDENGHTRDIYVYNRITGEMRNLTNGGNGVSDDPVLSEDGQWLAFRTVATNLPTNVPDSNGILSDIVIANVATGELTLVTANGNGHSISPSISHDGRRVVYETLANNLPEGDTHYPIGCSTLRTSFFTTLCISNVILYDRVSRSTLNLTQSETTPSRAPNINASGTHVVFVSGAFPVNEIVTSVVVIELETGSRTVVDSTIRLEQTRPVISPDGRFVAAMNVPAAVCGTRNCSSPRYRLHVFDTQTGTSRVLGDFSSLPAEFTSDSGYLVFTEAADRTAVFNRREPADSAVYGVELFGPNQYVREPLTPVGNELSGGPSISSDGSVLVWDSTATDFANDNNGRFYDIFILDNSTDTTNQPPVAQPQSLSVTSGEEGQDLPITLTGFDADGDTLQFTIRDEPLRGTLSGVPPELTYRAEQGYSGTDRFSFVVQDAQATSAPAEVTISVVGATNSEHSLTAIQRADSRTIDLTATWPDSAVWTQVREFDGPTGILWDGQATLWNGTYTPQPGVASVTFNSRYWLPGVTVAQDSIDVTVQLAEQQGTTPDGPSIAGFAWLDTDNDGHRGSAEGADIGRAVTLYRCEPPWGIAGTATSAGATGAFVFTGLDAGKYQIGTAATGAMFSPVGNDNVITANGFSNCFDIAEDSAPAVVGIGVLAASATAVGLNGFAWIDSSNDGIRDATEAADAGRMVTAYRCEAPWGIVGTATSDADGHFNITGVNPGMYQFGIVATGLRISPKVVDNDLYSNGFSDCVDFTTGDPQIGMGIVGTSATQ